MRDPLPTDVDGLPALPSSFDAALDRALADLGLSLTRRARTAIATHVRLLIAWNRHVNLTAITDPVDIALDHVADSLAAVPILRSAGIRAILDLGSGGGFPGLPIAMALPADRALLLDSVAKKTRFLEAAAGATGLRGVIEVVTARAEELARRPEHRAHWPVVTARAVGSLADVAETGLPLIEVGGLLVVWKRRPIDDEVAAAATVIEAAGGGHPAIVAEGISDRPDNVLVVIDKTRPTPDRYPRDPARRRRRPRPGTSRVR